MVTPTYHFNYGWWLLVYGQKCGPFNSKQAARLAWVEWAGYRRSVRSK